MEEIQQTQQVQQTKKPMFTKEGWKNLNSNQWLLIRFIIFVGVALIAPLVYMFINFSMYGYHTYGEKDMFLTGWGIFGVSLVAVFAFYLLNSIRKLEPLGYFTQIINGFMFVILPLGLCYYITYVISKNVIILSQLLLVIILCEIPAIFINPIPYWIKTHQESKLSKLISLKIIDFHKDNKDKK